MEIKPYNEEHKAGVVDLILNIQRVEFSLPITLEDQSDLTNISKFYQKGMGNFWVALENESIIGTISLLDIGDNFLALRKMFVKKEFRGSKYQVAYKLLKVAEEYAKSVGVKSIYLGTTDKFLAAHQFYAKNGYSELAIDKLPDSFPVMDVDKIFYEKKL